MPLLKAMLGGVMAQLENSLDRQSPPTAPNLKALDRWFFLVLQVGKEAVGLEI